TAPALGLRAGNDVCPFYRRPSPRRRPTILGSVNFRRDPITMSALRTFLVEVIGLDKPKALNLKSRGLKNPPHNGDGAGGDMKQTVATLDADTESAALKSKVMERLADLVGPFKK